jgi:YHS domain-containing protein
VITVARCKCKICGTQLDTKTAYKIVVKDKSQYYCSQNEYENDLVQKKKAAEDKDKVYYLICDILGKKEVLNTALWKEKALWNKAFSDEFIAKYLEEKKDYLTSAVSKASSTEFAQIRYLSAILKNSLGDFKPKVIKVETPKVVVEEHYETKYKPKTRQALEDFEEDCYE